MAVAKAMAENAANDPYARARAMEFLVEQDSGARAFLRTFSKDKDAYVKRIAEDLINKAE